MKRYSCTRYWVGALLACLIASTSALAELPQIENNPDVQPSILRTTTPDITMLSIEQGIVIAKLVIDQNGQVTSVEIVKSSDQTLNTPVEEALKQWRFKPATKNGKACTSLIKIPVRIKA